MTDIISQIPFGYAGVLAIAIALYLGISKITEDQLEKRGIKPSTQYKDLQTGINAPAWAWAIAGASIPVIATLIGENFLQAKTNWTFIAIMSAALAIVALAIGLTKGAGSDKRITRV